MRMKNTLVWLCSLLVRPISFSQHCLLLDVCIRVYLHSLFVLTGMCWTVLMTIYRQFSN